MAIIDKDGYRRKEEWAARRMAKNAEIESLTQDQHKLLADLCCFRHKLHTNFDSVWNSESSDNSYFAREISIGYEDNERCLRSRFLDAFGVYPFERIDYVESATFDYDFNEGLFDCSYEEALDQVRFETYQILEELNGQIEAFLKSIDKENGTDYCPSGMSRKF